MCSINTVRKENSSRSNRQTSSESEYIKGTISRNFPSLVFFHRITSSGPNRRVKKQFRLFSRFKELFIFVIDSQVINTPGSQLESLNSILTRWLRDTLYTCDGFSAIRYFPLLFKIGKGNVIIHTRFHQTGFSCTF
jgi:hypothetical protein